MIETTWGGFGWGSSWGVFSLGGEYRLGIGWVNMFGAKGRGIGRWMSGGFWLVSR